MQAQTRGARRVASTGRVTARDVIMVIGLLAVLFVAASATGMRQHVEPRRMSAIRVAEGETLWDIAEDVELPGLSTAEKVAEIQRMNDLSGASIAAGSVVKIPASDVYQDAVAMR